MASVAVFSSPMAHAGISEARLRRRQSSRHSTSLRRNEEQSHQVESQPHGSHRDGRSLDESARQRRSRLKRSQKLAASSELEDRRTNRQTSEDHVDGAPSVSRHVAMTTSHLEDSCTGVTNLLQNIDKESFPQQLPDKESFPQQLAYKESFPQQLADTNHLESEASHYIPTEERPSPDLTHDMPYPRDAPPSDEVLSITVHGTDTLRANSHLIHPIVRVCVVDVEMGEYAKKSREDRCVASFYERGNPTVDYILPVMTQAFDCKEHNTIQPLWEESLILNEEIDFFTSNANLLLFFELLDFPPAPQLHSLPSSPWHRIAWAFIRPAGRDGNHNIGQRCRLQLHKYPKKMTCATDRIEVYDLWSRHIRSPYPSTLYVTLKPILLEQELLYQPCSRSMVPLQQEVGRVPYEDLLHQQPSVPTLPHQPSLTQQARLPGQPCGIPLSTPTTLHTHTNGCSVLAFSHNGRYLASGCADDDSYPVCIYEVPSFKCVMVTGGHRGLVYSLAWDPSDRLLASASADGLVKLWSLADCSTPLVCVLPHPCYVYAVALTNSKMGKVFTGCYDNSIRVWDVSGGSAQLLQDLRGHSGHVNCLCWGSMLYSGDSRGSVRVWREEEGTWRLKRSISVLQGVPVVSLSLHSNGRKLLVHASNGSLVMVDLRIDRICCEYRGLLVSPYARSTSLLSPCGGLVFAGGEKGAVHVWNSDSGEQLHVYPDTLLSTAVCAMAYHPHQHMIVLSAFGAHQPIVIISSGNSGAMAMGPEVAMATEGHITNSQLHRLAMVERTLKTVIRQ